MQKEVLLKVDELRTEFFSSKKSSVTAVDKVSFDIYKGEILGLVGESGCGKSVTSLSIMRLLKDTPGKVTHGHAILDGMDLLAASDAEIRAIRGGRMSMIFQEPMSALNPSMRIDRQMVETIRLHTDKTKEEARRHAADMLGKVGIPDPERRAKQYPHEFSGGMRQRVVIAIAAACRPDILICDEPTTALDVTIQAQILDLLKKLKKKYDLTTIYITHDLGVVANVADRIAVMYAGDIVEIGSCEEVFYTPKHPYTWALLNSLPQLGVKGEELPTIEGTPPNLFNEVHGDAFAPRNKQALAIDFEEEPPFFNVSETHIAKTWYLDPRAPKIEQPKSILSLRNKMKK